MDEVINLLRELLEKFTEVAETLEEISMKLDDIETTGIASTLEEISGKIDESVSDIVGETRYNLTDIHKDLINIDTNLTGIDMKIMAK